MKLFDGESPRFSGVFVASTLFASAAALFLSANLGCSEKPSAATRHGASQVATAQEKERQNRNMIDQVVRATEAQEDFPDPTYLRGALGRLNSWLEERPKTEDFEPDAEFSELAADCRELAATAKRASELVQLFRDETKTPTSNDADELQAVVEKAQTQTDALAEKLASPPLRGFGLFVAELREKLASAKEFQFADATETFQTQIRQFPQDPYFNFETLATGLETFATLLKVDSRTFFPQDAEFLKEAVWFRNVFNWAKGDKQDDFAVVLSLFDWSVKNVLPAANPPGPAGPIARLPWQTLLTSQGTPLDRALVFIELLRQHRLDAFVLRPLENAENSADNADFPLVVGVRIDGETYLFLPELGIPVPGPGADSISLKATVDGDGGGLSFDKIATLSQVAADDSILRRLDLDAERPFPAKSAQFAQTVALVPSTPFLSSERMILMEQEFSGSVYTVLSTPFARQKERIAALDGIADVKRLPEANAPILEHVLFPFESELLIQPYRYALSAGGSLEVSDGGDKTDDSIADYTKSESEKAAASSTDASTEADAAAKKSTSAPLWIGKILYFKGNFVDESGAAHWFQQARISDRVLKREEAQIPQKTQELIEQYVAWSRSQNVNPSQEEIQEIANQTVASLQAEAAMKRYIKIATKYYLAALSEAAGNDDAAISHLEDASLRRSPDAWRPAATYLLARIFENQGNASAAVNLLRSEPNDFGRNWRAKTLAELAGLTEEPAAPVEPAPEAPAETVEPAPEAPAETAEPAPEAPIETAEPAPEAPAETAEPAPETPAA